MCGSDERWGVALNTKQLLYLCVDPVCVVWRSTLGTGNFFTAFPVSFTCNFYSSTLKSFTDCHFQVHSNVSWLCCLFPQLCLSLAHRFDLKENTHMQADGNKTQRGAITSYLPVCPASTIHPHLTLDHTPFPQCFFHLGPQVCDDFSFLFFF